MTPQQETLIAGGIALLTSICWLISNLTNRVNERLIKALKEKCEGLEKLIDSQRELIGWQDTLKKIENGEIDWRVWTVENDKLTRRLSYNEQYHKPIETEVDNPTDRQQIPGVNM